MTFGDRALSLALYALSLKSVSLIQIRTCVKTHIHIFIQLGQKNDLTGMIRVVFGYMYNDADT
jgi:hypothetical protein